MSQRRPRYPKHGECQGQLPAHSLCRSHAAPKAHEYARVEKKLCKRSGFLVHGTDILSAYLSAKAVLSDNVSIHDTQRRVVHKRTKKNIMPLPGPCPPLMQPWYEEMEENPSF
jgi:hypothetical protein